MLDYMTMKQGFALVELLIALFIFSILSAIAFTSLQALSSSKNVVDRENQSLTQLQAAFTRLQRDVQQHVVLNNESSQLDRLELVSPASQITYLLKENQLWREMQASGSSQQRATSSQIVLTKINHVEWAIVQMNQGQFLKLAIEHQQLGQFEQWYRLRQSSKQIATWVANLNTLVPKSGVSAGAGSTVGIDPNAEITW
ncbi:PulJ/GspJ family protein [Thiolinea disciformis]|uniref:PulJ/GspJ family protein n=1 Tax=Thiolinea disciformis TaxID=125614 RepID=UPI000363201D|nr:prepilin-type N-terminal cleavage/methylation domain-containing protein [Thiolinea disciformis]